MNKGKLYLIPVPLSIDSPFGWDAYSLSIISQIRHFIVEEIRTARKFLRIAMPTFPIDECNFQILNEHTPNENIDHMLEEVIEGQDIGLMSEAGIPCIADPGAYIVALAHRHNIRIIPLSGSSSIILALASSGFNGQNFCFNGYLPIENNARKQHILELEQRSRHQTQIFMETPYRNIKLYSSLLQFCQPQTGLCIAAGLLSSNEFIRTMEIEHWRNFSPPIHKIPAIFLLGNMMSISR